MRNLGLVFLAAAVACGGTSKPVNTLPPFVKGAVQMSTYDGQSNDLLTGGVGKSGLVATAALPAFANPAAPTAAELRTRAIIVNYRALVDTTTAGGYGALWGPNIDVNGNDTLGDGKVAGDEWIAFDDDGSGTKMVTMMVQVPASFDRNNPCIVTATSSGSRGVYGAIATAGEWGLKHNCAVAYTDKGSGNQVHDLTNNTVSKIDGTRDTVANVGAASAFTANVSDADRAALANRLAVKHAHSQQNPEKDWGLDTLHAVQFAFYAINELHGEGNHVATFNQRNTITIAASVSNGGGAALAAAEQDTAGLITGVVAGEPQVYVGQTPTIVRGSTTQPATGKSLEDYVTLANLYQPCAAQAASAKASDLTAYTDATKGQARCAALVAAGLLSTASPDEALQKLHAAGWQPESDILHNSHFGLYATTAVAVTYANAYKMANVKDKLCGYGFAFTGASGTPTANQPVAPVASSLNAFFGNGNGVPPSSGINLIDENSVGGPLLDQASTTPSTNAQDYNTDGAVCLRNLANDPTIQQSVNAIKRTAKLQGKPTILVQGRSDALVPINHASRAYYAANLAADGASAQTVFYEVQNGQHFDAFLPLPGFSNHFVPLHRYVVQGLDLMWAHLKNGKPLPPSQVVRTTPRGSANLSTTNVPPIAASPAAGDAITFSGNTLTIPD